jgi:hypothetical protein
MKPWHLAHATSKAGIKSYLTSNSNPTCAAPTRRLSDLWSKHRVRLQLLSGVLPTISRENVLEAAKLGRLATHSPTAQACRADTQRRQAAARRAWNPKDKPEWLNEKAYRERIQPCLVGITVPTMMSALSVSEPYALRIRGGKCVPHPRHWLALAGLTGISGKE